MYTQTAEQTMLRDSIRRFMKSEVAPVVARHDQERTFPFELLKPLAEFGYLGGRLAEEEGGMGLDQLTWAMLMEEAGYAWLSLRTMLNITNAAINKLAAEATPAHNGFEEGFQGCLLVLEFDSFVFFLRMDVDYFNPSLFDNRVFCLF